MRNSIKGRLELALNWLPENCKRLLDCGCSDGNYTDLFSKKSVQTYAIDPNGEFIKNAEANNKKIVFKKAFLEKLPFEDNYFDVVTALEVIEHVKDEMKAVNEIHRVLKKNGTLIMTTPNKGLFSFLDQDNYVYYTIKYAPILYKLGYLLKKNQWLKNIKRHPGYENNHRHYSLKALHALLGDRFYIKQVFRSGFLLAPLSANIKLFITTLLGDKFYSKYFDKYVNYISSKEYCLSFGSLSYYIAIKAIKI